MNFAQKGIYKIRAACLDDVEQLVTTQLCLQKHMLDKNQLLWQINNKHLTRLTKYYRDLITDKNSRLVVLEDTDSGKIIGTGLGNKAVARIPIL